MTGEWDACVKKIEITQAEIVSRVHELGAQIATDYAGRNPVMIGALKGAMCFFADLVRAVPIPLEVDFITASSYGAGTSSQGEVTLSHLPETSLKGRDVIIVEDILDTGHTLSRILAVFNEQSPASLAVCTFLDKSSRREYAVPVRYRGFDIPDYFVVGYGLDLGGVYRNLPYVGVYEPEETSKNG